MVESYKKDDQPILKYFIYCASIELGLKAMVLGKNNSVEIKNILKYKVRHDLVKAYNFSIEFESFSLDIEGVDAITKINPYYKSKGLEYFTVDVIAALMKGLSDFPELEKLKDVCIRIQSFLILKDYYKN